MQLASQLADLEITFGMETRANDLPRPYAETCERGAYQAAFGH